MNQSIVELVVQAYNTGLLQYSPMTVCELTVSMVMHTHFNTLMVKGAGISQQINIYDTDSQSLQEADIRAVVLAVIGQDN